MEKVLRIGGWLWGLYAFAYQFSVLCATFGLSIFLFSCFPSSTVLGARSSSQPGTKLVEAVSSRPWSPPVRCPQPSQAVLRAVPLSFPHHHHFNTGLHRCLNGFFPQHPGQAFDEDLFKPNKSKHLTKFHLWKHTLQSSIFETTLQLLS